MEHLYENAVKVLPEFFSTQLQLDTGADGFFSTLKKIIEFDEGYVLFLNPDSIQLKYLYNPQKGFKADEIFGVNPKLQKELFKPDNLVLDADNQIIKILKLKNSKSYILSKLVIRNTVFGFILIGKKEADFYNGKSADVMNVSSSIISYLIKDIELSNVFKIQLRALKDGIEETNKAYKTIKEQNDKIVEADKVKNEFLANISHELRTPLNAIIGFSEVLSAKFFGELNERQEDYVKDIHVSGLHLLGMINEILDISKIESKAMNLNRSNFMIARAVDEVCNVVKPLANKKSITIEKVVNEDIEIYADYQKIQQIMYNLLSNAIKFTPVFGNITIAVEKKQKKMLLKISDNGIGIDEKYHGKIFGKFVQLESSFTKKESSTGLGLTITKELAELHGGKVSLQSEVNKGTTFIVEIPLIKDKNNG